MAISDRGGPIGRPSRIAVRGLTHVYVTEQGSLTALSDLDLDVRGGEFICIIGPSGGGKTTLLRAIGGLLRPTRGTIAIKGEPPREARRRKDVGFVFQDPSLLPWRTVVQNIRLPLELGSRRSGEDVDAAERMVETVGLSDFRDYYPHQLSGGMSQRVALARALATDPALLLMDEPLGSLDEITRAAMRYELTRLWEGSGKTVVMVTHSIAEAVIVSDRVVVMSPRPGRVVGEVDIELPRPRGEDMERSARFHDYANGIKRLLAWGATGGASAVEARTRVHA